MAKTTLRVIPLGGLGEIGKNMMILEYGEDIVVIDAGLMFPEQEMLGVDLVIPDITYLLENRNRVRGIVITHGHEDHIGALPYVLQQLNVPVYAPGLAHGFISGKLSERRMSKGLKLHKVEPGEEIRLGKLRAQLFRVCHSIPDAMGVALRTPLGMVVHTGDFKFDHTPVDGNPSDFAKLASLGAEGVLLLMSDSTYAELEGYTPSEQVVGETLDRVVSHAPGRVIVATFASLVSRVQQVINASVKQGRHVCIIGRSMTDTVKMAIKMEYLEAPEGVLVNPDQLRRLPLNEITIVATGAQGEPTSALVRMANGDHPQINIIPGDTVVISASAIPGNEMVVSRTIDNLFRQGAQVLYDKLEQVHVHGHASREELKIMIRLINPRFFMPIHGQYRHLALHGKIACSLGIPQENVFVMEDGDILELGEREGSLVGHIPAGPIYVDGLDAWDMDSMVLRDRRALSRDGIVVVIVAVDKHTGRVVGKPDVISSGFIDPQESRELLDKTKEVLARELERGGERPSDWGFIQSKVKDSLSRFLYQETRRRPMILTVALEV